MKLATIKKVEALTRELNAIKVKGCREQERATQKEVQEFIKKNAARRTGSSNAVLYISTEDFSSSRKYPDNYYAWNFASLGSLRETDKSFINTITGARILKSKIIGWCEL